MYVPCHALGWTHPGHCLCWWWAVGDKREPMQAVNIPCRHSQSTAHGNTHVFIHMSCSTTALALPHHPYPQWTLISLPHHLLPLLQWTSREGTTGYIPDGHCQLVLLALTFVLLLLHNHNPSRLNNNSNTKVGADEWHCQPPETSHKLDLQHHTWSSMPMSKIIMYVCKVQNNM